MLISLLSFAVIFTFLAVVHELGHLIWAKRAGIRVYEFGLGFGPRLLSFARQGTIYSLNLIPILAFVRIAGEGESEEDLVCPENERFYNKPPLQKLKAIVAGPAMNLLAAFLVLAFAISLAGLPSGISNEIAAITPRSPAEKAGLKVGDVLVSIDSIKFTNMEGAIDYIHKSRSNQLRLVINRGNRLVNITARPNFNKRLGVSLLGFMPKTTYKKTNPFHSLYHAAAQTILMILSTLFILFKLFTGGLSFLDLAGPVGIAQITGRYAQSGFLSLVYFAAFLNVNIGVINLLPLPALDGGHLVFILIELFAKRPLNRKLVNQINYWGFILLLAIMGLVTFNDLLRVFGRP